MSTTHFTGIAIKIESVRLEDLTEDKYITPNMKEGTLLTLKKGENFIAKEIYGTISQNYLNKELTLVEMTNKQRDYWGLLQMVSHEKKQILTVFIDNNPNIRYSIQDIKYQ